MTAIIGILNKAAVAIAADSAATVSNGTQAKVYNDANKIFNLCSGAPVAISIYNSAEFMGIPWETIVKMYRSSDKSTILPDLFDYAPNFIEFLDTFLSKISDEDEKSAVFQLAYNLFKTVVVAQLHNFLSNDATADSLPKDERDNYINSVLKDSLLPFVLNQVKQAKNIESFKGYKIESFTSSFGAEVRAAISHVFRNYITINEDNIQTMVGIAFEATVREHFYQSYTGLVFAGFGTNDIFPKLKAYKIGAVIDKRIRYVEDRDFTIEISNNEPSMIAPFAQVDIFHNFIAGIDPNIHASIPSIVLSTIEKMKTDAEPGSEDSKKLSELDSTLVAKFASSLATNILQQCIESNLEPIKSTIATLSKEDIAEMAESLINLTYLKRRVTFEQESVGGPVDVAIITKGDGFVWIKRKHYFRPELNLNYLSHVLK